MTAVYCKFTAEGQYNDIYLPSPFPSPRTERNTFHNLIRISTFFFHMFIFLQLLYTLIHFWPQCLSFHNNLLYFFQISCNRLFFLCKQQWPYHPEAPTTFCLPTSFFPSSSSLTSSLKVSSLTCLSRAAFSAPNISLDLASMSLEPLKSWKWHNHTSHNKLKQNNIFMNLLGKCHTSAAIACIHRHTQTHAHVPALTHSHTKTYYYCSTLPQ